MTFVQDILGQLESIGGAVRVRMERSLASGDYRELAELAGLAEAIERVLHNCSGQRKREASQAPHPDRSEFLEAGRTNKSGRRKSQTRTTVYPKLNPEARQTRGTYPYFVKDGDKLVKIAWSTKDEKEYEHRAPRSAVGDLIETVNKKAGAGKLFQVDDILPVPDENGDGVLPTYQVYLLLAWLRECGVIEKVGRDQYRLTDPGEAERAVKKCWMELASK